MVFVVGVGWQYGPGASGGSLGWVSWGVRRWGCHLGLDGLLVTLDAVSLAAACGAAGMPVPADVGCQPGGRTVPSGPGGGGLGIWGRSASGLGLRLGLGLAWVLVGVPPGAWVGACAGPGSGVGVFDASVASAGGGPIEVGKRALPGCLIVLCSWELTG